MQGPFEKLKRCAKDRKAAMEEVNSVLNSLAKYSQPGAAPPDDALASLDQMISNLTTLKRKVPVSPPPRPPFAWSALPRLAATRFHAR